MGVLSWGCLWCCWCSVASISSSTWSSLWAVTWASWGACTPTTRGRAHTTPRCVAASSADYLTLCARGQCNVLLNPVVGAQLQLEVQLLIEILGYLGVSQCVGITPVFCCSPHKVSSRILLLYYFTYIAPLTKREHQGDQYRPLPWHVYTLDSGMLPA